VESRKVKASIDAREDMHVLFLYLGTSSAPFLRFFFYGHSFFDYVEEIFFGWKMDARLCTLCLGQ